MSKLYDNMCILFSELKGKSYSKKGYTFLLLMFVTFVGSLMYFTPKVPNAVGCTWKANYKYTLVSERWRFNWFLINEDPDQCQRKNKKGDWLPMDNVNDSGDDE